MKKKYETVIRLFTLVFITLTSGVLAQNHVCNESFEDDRGSNVPDVWSVQQPNLGNAWGDWLERVHDPMNVETYEGEYALKIYPNALAAPAGSQGNRIGNYIFLGTGFPACGPNGALKANTMYMLSFMVKADNLTTSGSGGAITWINQHWQGSNNNYFSAGIPMGTYNWQQVTKTVTTSADPSELTGALFIEMNFLSGGTLWIDQVEFFEVIPSQIIMTAAPSQILPNGSSTITASIFDDYGHLINVATNDLTFTITGNGIFTQGPSPFTIAALYGQRQVTYLPNGVGQATITVSSPGLLPDSKTITITDMGQRGVPEIPIPYGGDVETDFWAYHPFNSASPTYNPLILSQHADGTPYTEYKVDDEYGGNIGLAVEAAVQAYQDDPTEKAKILLLGGNTYQVPDTAIFIEETDHMHFVSEGGIATIKAPDNFVGFDYYLGTSTNMIHIQAHAGDPILDNYQANNLTQTWKYLAPRKDFYFSNILFDMNNKAAKSVNLTIIKDIVFDNCEFINYTDYGVHGGCYVDNIWFRSCRFTSNTGQMATLMDGIHGSGYLDCDVDFNTDYGLDFFTTNDVTVDADLNCVLDPNEIRMCQYIVIEGNRFGLNGSSVNEVISVSGAQILVKNNVLGGDADAFARQKSGCNFNVGRRVHAPFYYTNFRLVGNTINAGVTLDDFFKISNYTNNLCEPAMATTTCTNPTDYTGYTGEYQIRGNDIKGNVLNPVRPNHTYPDAPYVTHVEDPTGNAILNPNYVCGNCYQDNTCTATDIGVRCMEPEPTYETLGCYTAAGSVFYLNQAIGDDSYSQAEAQNPSTPWKTFPHAIESMAPASTLIIKQGVYPGVNTEVEIGGDNGELGGTGPNAATIIKAAPGERVIITGPDVGGGVHKAQSIRLRGDYIRIEGIWFGGKWGEGNEFILGSNSIADIAEGREIVGCTFFGYNAIRDGYYKDFFMQNNHLIRMGKCLDPPAVFMAGRAGVEQYKTKAIFDNNIWIDGKGQAMVAWHSARNIMFTRNIVANVWGGVEFDDIYAGVQGGGPGGDHLVANNLFWNSGQTVLDPCMNSNVTYNGITHIASNLHSINNIMAEQSRIGAQPTVNDLENSSINKNAFYNVSAPNHAGDNSITLPTIDDFSTVSQANLETLFSDISQAFDQDLEDILYDPNIQGYFDEVNNSIKADGALNNTGQPWIPNNSQINVGPKIAAPGQCAEDFWNAFFLHDGIAPYSGFRNWDDKGKMVFTAQEFTFGDGSGPTLNYRGPCTSCWVLDYKALIAPPSANQVTLSFDIFDLGTGDGLKVYDGMDETGTLLGDFTGSTLPPQLVANSGAMLLHFYTNDDVNTGVGWRVSYIADGDPVIETSVTNLIPFLTTNVGENSLPKNFIASGNFLEEDILVTAPAEFEISLNEVGPYMPTLTLPQNNGVVENTIIYVRFAPQTPGTKTGEVVLTSNGATDGEVTISGAAAGNAPSGLWTGATSTDWNLAGNWDDNNIPIPTTNVLIPSGLTNYPVVGSTSQANCNNLTIDAGASLTLASDAAGTGSLIIDGTLTNNGTITSERYMPGANQAWHMVGSPVNNLSITASSFNPGATDDFYAWDEPSPGTWVNFKNQDGSGGNPSFPMANGDNNFHAGKGYLVAYDATNPTKSFVGNLTSGNIPFTLSYHAVKTDWIYNSGWNLLSNPYPSGIDWNDAIRSNFQDNFAYIYDPNKGGGEGYTTVNGSNPDAYIAPHQGFLVVADPGANGQVFNFTTSMKTHGGNYLKATDDNLLNLRLTSGNFYNETSLLLDAQSSFQRDRRDALKLFSFNPEIPQLYSFSSDQAQLSVNSIPYMDGTTTVNLGFLAAHQDTYQISLQTQTGNMNHIIYLEDKLTAQMHNLSQHSYSFTATEGQTDDRFTLHFGVTGINTLEQSNLSVYCVNSTLHIAGETGAATLEVLDLTGKRLSYKQVIIDGHYSENLTLSAGMYLVRIANDNQTKTAKVLIK